MSPSRFRVIPPRRHSAPKPIRIEIPKEGRAVEHRSFGLGTTVSFRQLDDGAFAVLARFGAESVLRLSTG